MSEMVTLTMTREHAQVVQDACEVLMRMKLGQTMQPTELMLGWPAHDGMDTEEYLLRRDIAEGVLRSFLLAVDCEPGCEKDKVEMMAYEVWGTIRHALWKDDHPAGTDSWSVARQMPLSESGLDMPKCEVRRMRGGRVNVPGTRQRLQSRGLRSGGEIP